MEGIHAGEAVVSPPAILPPLAAVLTGRLLHDGELVLLILRPSLWMIPLSSLRFITAVVICMIAARIYQDRLPDINRTWLDTGIFLIAARLTWSLTVWLGRLYILTDLRILRLSGVFRPELFDCPLRKVARTRLVYTFKEKLLGVGSIEIVPSVDEIPDGAWQTVATPRLVHERIVAAVNRAKQTGRGGDSG